MLTIHPLVSGVRQAGGVDLQARLDGYEVTALPSPRPTLALVWSEPEPSADAEPEPATFGVLALLDDYRITRVPARRAS
jgi:hypothetical protein